MCFLIRFHYSDENVFLYCFHYGFFISLDVWESFVEDFRLELINEHPSSDPTSHYCVYVCSLDNVEHALARIKSLYLDNKNGLL